MSSPRLLTRLLALALAGPLACAPGKTEPAAAQAAPQGPAVQVQPPEAAVDAGGTAQFAAVVTGTVNTSVQWKVQEVSGGTVDATGRYTAPATAGTYHVVATSAADGVTAGSATVTVSAPPPPPPPPSVVVTLGPVPADVDACRTLTFTATVTGTADTSVDWSVQEGAAGGTISAAGVYTAPSTGGIYHVVATSRAAPSSSATLAVGVTERVLSVAIDPPQVTLQANGTAQFTATVTTTCGSVTAAQKVALAR